MVTGSSSMTIAERLARFAARASYDDLSEAAREQLKIRVLDALACAIGALDGEPVRLVRAQVEEFDGAGPCSLIGGGHAAPDRAAFYNSALVRYLDFNDSYLTKGETCHPSDNLGAVLAAAEYAGASGRDFPAALALAYQVQCRLSDVAPVRDAGRDHVTQGAYAVAAGGARALGLDPTRTAHAIAGTAFNALRVTRTGLLSHWKGLAYPNVAGAVTRTTFLARRGITGPLEVFEGGHAITHAVTHSGREVRPEHASPGVTNLLTIYELLSGRRREAVHAAFVGKGYTVLKRAVADLVVSTLEPIRQRYLELSAQPEALDAILAEGAERARLLAAPTLDRVEQLMGLHERSHVPFPLSTLWRADVVQCEAARHEETV